MHGVAPGSLPSFAISNPNTVSLQARDPNATVHNDRVKVMVVEDELIIALDIQKQLIEAGFAVTGWAPTAEATFFAWPSLYFRLRQITLNSVPAHNAFHSARRQDVSAPLRASDAATSSTLTASSFQPNCPHRPETAASAPRRHISVGSKAILKLPPRRFSARLTARAFN